MTVSSLSTQIWTVHNIYFVLTYLQRHAMLRPMTQDTFLHMRIAEEVKLMLDDLRKGEPDLPSRSEMVRRLIERAHESEKKRGRK